MKNNEDPGSNRGLAGRGVEGASWFVVIGSMTLFAAVLLPVLISAVANVSRVGAVVTAVVVIALLSVAVTTAWRRLRRRPEPGTAQAPVAKPAFVHAHR
jgi:Na+/melibiose symporter-like transporter